MASIRVFQIEPIDDIVKIKAYIDGEEGLFWFSAEITRECWHNSAISVVELIKGLVPSREIMKMYKVAAQRRLGLCPT